MHTILNASMMVDEWNHVDVYVTLQINFLDELEGQISLPAFSTWGCPGNEARVLAPRWCPDRVTENSIISDTRQPSLEFWFCNEFPTSPWEVT